MTTTIERKANPALMKPMRPSAELAEIIGPEPLPRTEITKRMWAIKEHNLQNPVNKREILADEKLERALGEICQHLPDDQAHQQTVERCISPASFTTAPGLTFPLKRRTGSQRRKNVDDGATLTSAAARRSYYSCSTRVL